MKKSERGKRSIPRDLKIFFIIAAVFAAFTAVLFIINIFTPVKYLSAFWVIADDKPQNGQTRVRFLSVDYGDCTLVEFPDGKVLLIDGGDGSYAHSKTVLKALNRSGIDKIDYAVCSSVKSLRSAGLAEVLKYKKADKLYAPYCVSENITDGYKKLRKVVEGVNTEYCEYGAGVFEEDYGFCFLSPGTRLNQGEGSDYYLLNNDPSEQNIDNTSAAIYIYCGDTGVFPVAGFGWGAPKNLKNDYKFVGGFEMNGKKIQLDNVALVKAANHGAEYAQCSEIYDGLKPKYTVISASGDMPPSQQVISDAERYSGLFMTNDGTVTAIIDNGNIRVFN